MCVCRVHIYLSLKKEWPKKSKNYALLCPKKYKLNKTIRMCAMIRVTEVTNEWLRYLTAFHIKFFLRRLCKKDNFHLSKTKSYNFHFCLKRTKDNSKNIAIKDCEKSNSFVFGHYYCNHSYSCFGVPLFIFFFWWETIATLFFVTPAAKKIYKSAIVFLFLCVSFTHSWTVIAEE